MKYSFCIKGADYLYRAHIQETERRKICFSVGNVVQYSWTGKDMVTQSLSFKVHAISTEFTPKKHGGEKGVPFRIQIETYSHNDGEEKLLHAASCQVKVFKVGQGVACVTGVAWVMSLSDGMFLGIEIRCLSGSRVLCLSCLRILL